MTYYEIINSLIAVVAVVISLVSLVRSRNVQAKQLEFEAVSAALAKKQLGILETKEKKLTQAKVTAELVEVGNSEYRFVIMNQSSSVASDVAFEIDRASPDNPLMLGECREKLPYRSLQPGQSFTLIAALHVGSAMMYETHLSWKNPDGSPGTSTVYVST